MTISNLDYFELKGVGYVSIDKTSRIKPFEVTWEYECEALEHQAFADIYHADEFFKMKCSIIQNRGEVI
jgi:hypothetical protein